MREYKVIDADCHILEPPHIWETWLPGKFRDKAPRLVKDSEGGDAWQFEQGGGLMHIGLVATPGMSFEKMKWEGYGYDDIRPGCFDGKARLADMDMDGVDAQFIYPSQRTMYHFMGSPDSDFHLAGVQAYNNFMAKEFCAADQDRLFFLAQMPNLGPDAMIKEMQRCREMGCNGVIITTWPCGGDELCREDEMFFAAAAEMRMPVNIHVAIRRKSANPKLNITGVSAIGAMACAGVLNFLPIMTEIIMSGIFDRLPNLKIHGVEVEAGWIPWAFEAIDNFYWRNRTHTGVSIKEMPSYYWQHHFAVTFIQDFTAIRNRHAIGVENLMWSSDYPHHGNDWPYSRRLISEMMRDVSAHERYLMCAGNAVNRFGLEQSYVPPSAS